jgi:YihY family inner membrane protein
VSTIAPVPETRDLDGDDAWTTLRRVGRRRLLVDAFTRMRYSDGFSHARSLAFMSSLAIIQLVIAAVGLSGATGSHGFSQVVTRVVRQVVPGPAGQALTAVAAQAHANGSQHRYVAVLVGLVGGLVTTTTALGQLERGLNRLYGVEQDRPFAEKYGRALGLALSAGTLTALAFIALAWGGDLLRPVTSAGVSEGWNTVRWPLGLILVAVAVTVLFRWCPRRHQPRLSWLAFGAGLAVASWAVVTVGLAGFFHLSRSFGQTYGPLAGVVALMLWSLLSSIALFYGAAVVAQLEAQRQGRPNPQGGPTAMDAPGPWQREPGARMVKTSSG